MAEKPPLDTAIKSPDKIEQSKKVSAPKLTDPDAIREKSKLSSIN